MTTSGPNTPEGKAAVAHNSVRHGLNTVAIVIPGAESQEEWDALRTEIFESLDPVGPIEEALAHRAAESFWRLRRVTRAERQAVIDGRDSHQNRKEFREANFSKVPDDSLLGDFLNPAYLYSPDELPSEKTLDSIIRYEAHLNRQLYQALHELEARQDRRNGKAAPLARLQFHQ